MAKKAAQRAVARKKTSKSSGVKRKRAVTKKTARKKSGSRRGNGLANGAAIVEDPAVSRLDQIRNILIGEHASENKKQVAGLEQRLEHELSAFKATLTKRIDAIEAASKKESAALSGRLRMELEARGEGDKAVRRDLAALGKTLQGKLAEHAEQSRVALKELRDDLKSGLTELGATLNERCDLMVEEHDGAVDELREASVTKAELSSFLAEIALKLVDRKQIRRS